MANFPANIRVNTAVPFPALVIGKGPITIDKNFGVWRVGFDASQINIVVPSLSDYTTSYFIVHNALNNTLERVSLATLISGGGSGNTPVDLITTDGVPTTFPTTVLVLPFQSWGFNGEVIARDVATGDSSIWKFEGAIKQGLDVSTTVLVAPITPVLIAQDAGAAAWGLILSADVTGGTLKVQAQGEAGKTIYWELRPESEHVTTPAPPVAPIEFVAVGLLNNGEATTEPFIVSSTDGVAWVQRSSGVVTTGGFTAATFGASKFVIAGTDGTVTAILATSGDGISWTYQTTGFGAALSGIFGLTFGLSLFVAAGVKTDTTGEIETSPDGVTWTSRTNGFDTAIQSVFFGNSLFIASGTLTSGAGEIETSTDAITWTQRSHGFGNPGIIDCAAFGATLFAVGGQKADGSAEIETSPDGTTWTTRVQGFGAGGIVKALAFGAGVFVAGGSTSTDGEIETSPDGITWTQRTHGFGTGGSIDGVTFSNSQFVAVGVDAAGQNHIETSPDGTTWTAQPTGITGTTSSALFGVV